MSTDRERQLQSDSQDLHQFGYAQQLLRDMGGFANFAVSFTVISILTGAIALFGHGLNFGGPAVNGFGWLIVAAFTMLVAASMAEIASAIPTAGAMYHWAAILGGPGWGWFTAWFNFVGQMATTAGIGYTIAQFAVDLLGWQGQANLLILYAAILVSWGLINHYGIRLVSWANEFSVWYHIAVTLAIMIAFLFFAPRQPVSFLFKTGFTTSKYPYAWAFLVGLLQAQWTITGYDASAHITEETVDPRRNAPWGLFLAVVVSAIFGYGLLVAVTLGIQDLAASAAAANPFIDVAERAFGKWWGSAMDWAIMPAMWCCGLSSITANARMTFAFARDKGMPGWRQWCKVSPKFRTPAHAVWLSVALAFVVALYSGAFNVIASLSTIGLYVSYIIPVVLVLRARLSGKWAELGPWNLGKWGFAINAAAILWTAFICVLFVAPPNERTGYTFGALTVLLTVYYLAGVRGRFEGPKKVGTEEDLLKLEAELSA
ncbi:MAG: amino acid permease [Elusimicrobia bacterium]|nr:amino acid permease [Elusimicrobiota bacterium]